MSESKYNFMLFKIEGCELTLSYNNLRAYPNNRPEYQIRFHFH